MLAVAWSVGSVMVQADSPLAEQMELVDSAYKAIKRADDAATCAKEARDGQAACLKALALAPALVEKMPAGPAKDKALAEYRLQMGELYVTFCKAELACLGGKLDQVPALVEEFKAHKKRGHDQFMEEEE
jgi:soluble cytochrome b562